MIRTRRQVQRAREDASEPRFARATTDEPQAVADASKANLDGVSAGIGNPGSGSERETGMTQGLTALRTKPTVRVHPLRVYLLERDVGIAEGAELLGISERSLRDVLTWRRRFKFWRERDIAIELGLEPGNLFPEA